MQCHYNMVNFLKNINERQPIAHPLRRGMGCLLWIQHLIHILPEFLQSFMQYLVTFDCIITALNCTTFLLQGNVVEMSSANSPPFSSGLNISTFLMLKLAIFNQEKQSQYHDCWCPFITRSSATMVLTMQDEQVHVFTKYFHCLCNLRNDRNCNTFLYFWKRIQHSKC